MPMVSRPALRGMFCLGVLGLLQACASRPTVTSSTEAHRYRSRAQHNYLPPGPRNDPWGPYIHEASVKYDVPTRWIRAVMHQESGGSLYQHGELITSSAGAMGLMQVMPGTYDELRGRYAELGDDPFDPHDNIMAGTAYLREMYDIYGSPGFLAAYNAGPGRLDDFLTRSRPLPAETRRYVAAIGPNLRGAEPGRASPGEQFAMNAVPYSAPMAASYPVPQPAFAAAPPPLPVSAPVQVAEAEVRPAYQAPVQRYEPPVQAYAPPAREYAPPPRAYQAPIRVARAEPPFRAYAPEAYVPKVNGMRVARALPPPLPFERARPTLTLRGPVQVAELPEQRLPRLAARAEPGRALPLPPRMPFEMAALSQPAPGGHGFHLISPAMAEPIGVQHGGTERGDWSVQVGAFGNSRQASQAAASARNAAHGMLAVAHPSVGAVREGHGVLYRARLQGLSHDAAARACQQLSKQRTNCILVSPAARS